MSTESPASRRARYDRDSRATIPRSAIGLNGGVMIPENVERREFHAPCRLCGASGACRHRRSQFAESQPESATA